MKERLSEIRGRLERATEGPWQGWSFKERQEDNISIHGAPRKYRHIQIMNRDSSDVIVGNSNSIDHPNIMNDSDFIAHSREDVPWLLDRLQNAEDRVEIMKQYMMEKCGVSELIAEGFATFCKGDIPPEAIEMAKRVEERLTDSCST